MRSSKFVFLFFACLTATTVSFAGDAKTGLDVLQGKWTATSWKRGKGEVPKDKVDTELVITKDAYQFPSGINRISKNGTFKLEAGKNTIDFTPTDGPTKGKALLGIYKVEGTKLTLCFSTAGMDRPKEFMTDNANTVLATYELKK